MKKIFFIVVAFLFLGCASNSNSAAENNEHGIAAQKNEDGEWDIEVIDTQYNYFLTAIAKPIEFYSESYLKNKNTFLVSEWNSYYFSGKYRNIIESSIDYSPQENYGKKFEYKLYQAFAYVQWKYGLKLNGLSQTEVR